jgi:DNA-binding HxlR family transcriptional regulator
MERDDAGYGQYCPVSRALDVIGERWSLLILRDMILGATRFNDLARGLPGLSRSLLAKRLRQLEHAGVLRREGVEYVLTESGRGLQSIVFGLSDWGAQWAFGDPDPAELDAELLVWWMHTRLDTSGFPGKRHVIGLRFTDDPRPYWVVNERGVPSVCRSDPGFGTDVTVTADVRSLYLVWMGRLPLHRAVHAGLVRFDGTGDLVQQMPRVLQLSPVAGTVTSMMTLSGS